MSALRRLFVLLAVTVLGAACAAAPATSQAPSSTAAAVASPSATPKVHYDVVIAEIGQIGPVLQTVAGFKSALAAAGLVEGRNVTYSEKNAHGDQATVELMSKQIVEQKPDLIFAAGTSVVLALSKQTKTIPIIFGGMTDPVGSGVAVSADHPGHNLTGTSDYLDPNVLLDLTTSTLPNVKRIGLIGNPGEQNTAVQIKALTEAAKKRGLELTVAPLSSTADVLPAVESLKGRVDAVILPQDNTVGSAFQTVSQALTSADLPIIASNTARVQQGQALVGVGVDYKALGTLAGDQAVKVLRDGAKIGDLPVIFGNSPAGGGLTVAVSATMAAKLRITVPQAVLDKAQVYQ